MNMKSKLVEEVNSLKYFKIFLKTSGQDANMDQKQYDPKKFLHHQQIKISSETEELLRKATETYDQNFDGQAWYGRCIFISWYCSLDDCAFCFRSAKKFQKLHPKGTRRTMESILLEALFCRIFNWRIEFLTGGYGMLPFAELLEIVRNVYKVYGKKLWLNIGVISKQNLEQLHPYVKGIVASIETANPELHRKICPSKPIQPYEQMIAELDTLGYKKSAAFIIGLGEEITEINHLFDFIGKHQLDRITVYALKPVKGTIYTQGPSVDEYLQWLARVRIKFPKLEIIAGTNLRRCEEAGYLMKAGVNAVTKFPATKQFGTKKAVLFEKLIREERKKFISNLTKLPDFDWDGEIEKLDIDDKYKTKMKALLPGYLHTFSHPKDKDIYLDD